MNQLTITSLAVYQDGKALVNPVSMSLKRGESITILGETGSGKSMFSKAIIGDLPSGFHAEGHIELNGQSLLDMPKQAHQALWGKSIAILPQEPRLSLSPLMTVQRQVAEVHQLVLGRKKAQSTLLSKQAFQALSLEQHSRKHPVELSGGMAQRSAFLAATAANATLLIADEPTKGLDDKSKQQVIDQLLAHKETGSLITITHDLEVAKALGGKVYVLLQGEWVAQEMTFDQLKNSTSDSYTAGLFNPHQAASQPSQRSLGDVVIEAKKLSMGFGRQHLFSDLCFTLRQGEVLGLSGASGCGKSTLCDLLLGLKTPLSGTIEHQVSFDVGQRLKLYQDPPQSFSASFTLIRQLEDVCQRHNIDKSEIDKYRQRLKVKADVLSRLPSEVSGGELQRVAILRALLLKPKLLIADEPTTRLDPHIAHQTMKLLIESVQEIRCALVLVSHNHSELERYCDKRLCFEGDGIVVAAESLVAGTGTLVAGTDTLSLSSTL